MEVEDYRLFLKGQKYFDEGEKTVSKEDVPWIKTFSSKEEIICRMQIIERQLHEEISI